MAVWMDVDTWLRLQDPDPATPRVRVAVADPEPLPDRSPSCWSGSTRLPLPTSAAGLTGAGGHYSGRRAALISDPALAREFYELCLAEGVGPIRKALELSRQSLQDVWIAHGWKAPGRVMQPRGARPEGWAHERPRPGQQSPSARGAQRPTRFAAVRGPRPLRGPAWPGRLPAGRAPIPYPLRSQGPLRAHECSLGLRPSLDSSAAGMGRRHPVARGGRGPEPDQQAGGGPNAAVRARLAGAGLTSRPLPALPAPPQPRLLEVSRAEEVRP
jgi:hypothetical protein